MRLAEKLDWKGLITRPSIYQQYLPTAKHPHKSCSPHIFIVKFLYSYIIYYVCRIVIISIVIVAVILLLRYIIIVVISLHFHEGYL
jgi:hypothetical protein